MAGPGRRNGPWHAVDAGGRDLGTGRPPRPPGARSAAAALAGAPVAAWPLAAVTEDGRCLGLAEALGPGGEQVEQLLDRLLLPAGPPAASRVAALARDTPAGPVELPVAVVAVDAGVEASTALDRAWLSAVEDRRRQPRRALVDAGRGPELEAALHVAMLLATERLAPGDGEHGRVASGGCLWLLGAAVAWALTDAHPHPFSSWADLVVAGLWPVGPSAGRLVVADVAGAE